MKRKSFKKKHVRLLTEKISRYRHKGRIALALIAVILFCDVPSIVYAATTQEQLDEALEEKEELDNKIDENQENLNDLEGVGAGLQADLQSLNTQLTEISDRLTELNGQIAQKELEIAETEAALEEARATEAWQYTCMVERIRYIYESGETDYLEILFSAGSFSALLNSKDYLKAIAEYDQKMLASYEETRMLIEEKEALLHQEKLELEGLVLEAESEKSKIAGLISQTADRITANEDEIAAAEEEMKRLEAERRQAEEDIEALRKKIEEEKRLSQLALNSTWRDISEIEFADGDLKLLASIIYCEAGGEPYEGQLAVGAVVINRMLSSRYPDTMVEVIYQRKQFSPVGSGRLELVLTTNRATASCYQAAQEAMSGVTNVGSCLYFRTPIPGLTGINIGGHVFY
ncbi:MAG: cell wall hydrolase [Lachnospiraceae bacterium]|nr:cell wall hydrolase [Lachnospiraceae bacterium]